MTREEGQARPAYDMAHLDDVRLGHEHQRALMTSPNDVFFGILGALLLPAGALIVPLWPLIKNFQKRRAWAHIASFCGLYIVHTGLCHLWPWPMLRRASTVILGFAWLIIAARWMRHELATRHAEVSENPRLRHGLIAFFILALVIHSQAWALVINLQIRQQLSSLKSQSPREDHEIEALLHYQWEVKTGFGRLTWLVLKEQVRSLKQANEEQQRWLIEHWDQAAEALAGKVEAASAKLKDTNKVFRGFEQAITVPEMKRMIGHE